MARTYSAEYAQWLEENNFSQADEKLLLKTVTGRMFIWFLLSCIPGAGFFVLPLFMNAWTWRKIIRKKTFEPRPGLLYGFCALAMYITFIAIIPWILWALAKRNQWGTGIRRLIKKGKIGKVTGAVSVGVDSDDASHSTAVYQEQKRGFPWWILVVLLVILIGVAMVFGLTNRKEPMAAEAAVLQNYEPTSVFLPGESHGQRSLAGYSPRGRKESNTTEQLHFFTFNLSPPVFSVFDLQLSFSHWIHGFSLFVKL